MTKKQLNFPVSIPTCWIFLATSVVSSPGEVVDASNISGASTSDTSWPTKWWNFVWVTTTFLPKKNSKHVYINLSTPLQDIIVKFCLGPPHVFFKQSWVSKLQELPGLDLPMTTPPPTGSTTPEVERTTRSFARSSASRISCCLFWCPTQFLPEKQGEPENPKDKPDTRKPIFYVRLILRVHFVIRVTISTWEPKRTSNGNLPPSLSRIRLSCIQLIRLLLFSFQTDTTH